MMQNKSVTLIPRNLDKSVYEILRLIFVKLNEKKGMHWHIFHDSKSFSPGKFYKELLLKEFEILKPKTQN